MNKELKPPEYSKVVEAWDESLNKSIFEKLMRRIMKPKKPRKPCK